MNREKTGSLQRTHDTEAEKIGGLFETGFFDRPLEVQVRNCDHYELVPLFREWLPHHQPILEAGSGSGRWVAWFVRQGWEATGLDWSESLCARARKEVPGGKFVAGDMREMPFEDGVFGSIVSLGAIEHASEGPSRSLCEYRRVMREDGMAVITVPFLGPVRRIRRAVGRLLNRSRAVAQAQDDRVRDEWAPDFLISEDGIAFFQYNFTRQQMRRFLNEAGFTVIREFVDFADEGILHNFGKLAGRYDRENSRVRFSLPGRLLRAVIPSRWVGHMLCYVVSPTKRGVSL
jgi:SAM-dependent methyltransferase